MITEILGLRPFAKFGHLVKSKESVSFADIVKHFKEKVEPNGFKGQVVVYDREACDLYKQELDRHMPPEETAVVMTQPPHQGIRTQNYSVAKRYGFWRPHQWIHTQFIKNHDTILELTLQF